MSTLTITIGILAPVITFLIGRYFRAVKVKELDNVAKARDYWEEQYYKVWDKKEVLQTDLDKCENLLYEVTSKFPKFELVANKQKHPAANDNYLYIEGEINGNREAGLFKLSDWSKAKERLLKNPEDKPNHE
jgi:hypothetical protein